MGAYFKSLGAEISEERSEKGLEDDLHKIIGVCDASFKDATENEVEGIMNGIVSMLACALGTNPSHSFSLSARSCPKLRQQNWAWSA